MAFICSNVIASEALLLRLNCSLSSPILIRDDRGGLTSGLINVCGIDKKMGVFYGYYEESSDGVRQVTKHPLSQLENYYLVLEKLPRSRIFLEVGPNGELIVKDEEGNLANGELLGKDGRLTLDISQL
jgi:hypothetical protein